MNKYDFIELDYKFRHATTIKQKQAVLAAYPELKGFTIQQVKGMIQTNKWVTTGVTIPQQKRNEELRKRHKRRKFCFDE